MTDLPPTGHHAAASSSYQLRINGWFARLLALTVLIAMVIVAVLFIVPALIILFVLGVLFIIYIRIKMMLTKARDPGGPLDKRKNVRVVSRDE